MRVSRASRLASAVVSVLAVAGLAVAAQAAGTSTETTARATRPAAAADPAVIRDWDAIAVSTIAGPAPNGAGKANVEGFFWFPFVQAAVYNAVNGITGEYELYKWNAKAPKGSISASRGGGGGARGPDGVLRQR